MCGAPQSPHTQQRQASLKAEADSTRVLSLSSGFGGPPLQVRPWMLILAVLLRSPERHHRARAPASWPESVPNNVRRRVRWSIGITCTHVASAERIS